MCDDVIVPAYTMDGQRAAVLFAVAFPVFVYVDPGHVLSGC